MHGISVNAFSKIGANGACSGFLRISSAHQVTIFQNRVFAFQSLNHHRARNHEADQIFKERTLFVNAVKSFSFTSRQVYELGSNDLEAGCFKAGKNLADDVFCHSVGFDDGECAFDRHRFSFRQFCGIFRMNTASEFNPLARQSPTKALMAARAVSDSHRHHGHPDCYCGSRPLGYHCPDAVDFEYRVVASTYQHQYNQRMFS